MSHFIKNIVLLAFVAALFSGCANQYDPMPSDTILKNPHESRPNWIDENNTYSEQGLSLRTQDTILGNFMNECMNRAPVTSIYFSYDRVDIQPSERNKLLSFMDTLRHNPIASFLLIGRCDWHGTEEYNASLGDRRANAVKSYLAELGVDPMRIKTLSKGSLEAQQGLSVEDAWIDRRVDIVVLE